MTEKIKYYSSEKNAIIKLYAIPLVW